MATDTKNRKRQFVIPCGIAVIRRGRQFLISQRNPGDTFGSYWEFPGGKKNPKESFEQCVVREAREELGVTVKVQKKLLEFRKQHNNRVIWLNFYLCSHESGEPRAIECQTFRWTDLDDLKNYAFPPANEIVIERLLKDFGVDG